MTNGTFSSQPAAAGAAAGTDLGNWRSGRTYTGSSVDASETQVAAQTGTASYRTNNALLQTPFPGDAANGVPSSNTWLLYNGNLGAGSNTATSNIWYQDLPIVAGGIYTFSFYVSNALNPALSGKALPVVNARLRSATTGNSISSLGNTTVNEEATANNGVDTWQRVQFTISAATSANAVATTGSSTIRFSLGDASGGGAAVVDGGDVAITGISLRRVNQLPRGQQTAPTVFGRQGAVALPTLRANDPDPDGSIARIKSRAYPRPARACFT